MQVGNLEKREVSELNHTLFEKAREIMEAATDVGKHRSHIGWSGVGDFVDYLEANYDLTPKEKTDG